MKRPRRGGYRLRRSLLPSARPIRMEKTTMSATTTKFMTIVPSRIAGLTASASPRPKRWYPGSLAEAKGNSSGATFDPGLTA